MKKKKKTSRLPQEVVSPPAPKVITVVIPSEELLDAIRNASPADRSTPVSPAEITAEVLASTKEFTVNAIWSGIKALVARGDMERATATGKDYFAGFLKKKGELPSALSEGERYLYRLTVQGTGNRPARVMADGVFDRRKEQFVHHKGKTTCPRCKGKDTATNADMATFPVVRFFCFPCRVGYRKAAKDVPGLLIDPQMKRVARSSTKGESVMAKKASKKSASKKSAPAKVAAKKERKGGPSRFQMLRDAFATRKSVKRDELAKLTGWKPSEVHTAMSILRNPDRMSAEKLLVTDYEKESQTYTRAK